MKTIAELRDEMNHKVHSAKDIKDRADKDKRPLTDQETADAKQLLLDADNLKAEIKRLEDQNTLLEQIDGYTNSLKEPQNRVVSPSTPSNGGGVPQSDVRVSSFTQRYGSLKAFTHGDGKTFRNAEAAERAALKCGHWFAATIYGSTASERWLTTNFGSNWRATMTEGTNTAGGYLVPDEMAQAIIDLRENYGVFRRYARVRPMGSEPLKVGRSVGHVTASFTAEATAASASDRSYGQTQLNAKDLVALTYISRNLIDDAIISVIDDVSKDMAWAFAKKEDECGFTGDGTATYGGIRGLTNYFTAGALAGAVDATSGHDTIEEIDVDDIMRVRAKLPEYVMEPKWYCSKAFKSLVFDTFKASAGGNDTITLNGKLVPAFLGDEIVVSQVLPRVTTTINDTPMCFYGDLSMAASLGERRGIGIERSNEVKWAERQVGLMGWERIDIACHDVGDGTDAGPIVALVGNT